MAKSSGHQLGRSLGEEKEKFRSVEIILWSLHQIQMLLAFSIRRMFWQQSGEEFDKRTDMRHHTSFSQQPLLLLCNTSGRWVGQSYIDV